MSSRQLSLDCGDSGKLTYHFCSLSVSVPNRLFEHVPAEIGSHAAGHQRRSILASSFRRYGRFSFRRPVARVEGTVPVVLLVMALMSVSDFLLLVAADARQVAPRH